MELLIAILLWMNVLVPDQHYTQDEFDMLVQSNQQSIDAVLADPTLTETVWADTHTDIPAIIVGEGE